MPDLKESLQNPSMKDGKHMLTCNLRDELASLRWELWENEPVLQRDKLPEISMEACWLEDHQKEYVQFILTGEG